MFNPYLKIEIIFFSIMEVILFSIETKDGYVRYNMWVGKGMEQ